jgi:small subunit ribosomal protein S1
MSIEEKNGEQTPTVTVRKQKPQEGAEAPEVAVEVEVAPQEAPQAAAEEPARRRVFDPATAGPAVPVEAAQPQEAPASEQDYADQEAEFAAMMADADQKPRKRGPMFEDGQPVQGTVVLIGEENVFLNLGARVEGVISRRELLNAEGELSVALGDKVDAYVLRVTSSFIDLGKTFSAKAEGHDALEQAYAAQIPVEGHVTGVNKGGYEILLMGQRAFCPLSQIEQDFTEHPEAHIGKGYRFLISRFEAQGKTLNIVVSRAELIRRERAAAAEQTLQTLAVGQVRKGSVRRLAPFGAFVDLGGVDGLIHVSEMGWSRVSDPAEVVQLGQEVEVRVLDIQNREAGPEKMRVSLSMRSAQEDPWGDAAARFPEGSTHTGEVVRLESFGAFIQLSAGIDGLVHVSEMSLARVVRPQDFVQVGQQVQVQVKQIDPARQRLSLSMKSLQGDPWNTIHERYAEGMEVSGTVEKVEDFGVFVLLEPGVTALLPLSEMGTERGRSPHMDFHAGHTAQARVLQIDAERRRMSLTRKSEEQRQQDSERRTKAQEAESEARPPRKEQRDRAMNSYRESASLGTFADLLAARGRNDKRK